MCLQSLNRWVYLTLWAWIDALKAKIEETFCRRILWEGPFIIWNIGQNIDEGKIILVGNDFPINWQVFCEEWAKVVFCIFYDFCCDSGGWKAIVFHKGQLIKVGLKNFLDEGAEEMEIFVGEIFLTRFPNRLIWRYLIKYCRIVMFRQLCKVFKYFWEYFLI